jgi:hypothetical protein
MKPDNIDFYDGGEDIDFLEIGTRDRKIKLLLDFLIKTDIEFSIKDFDNGKIVELGDGIECVFNNAGRINFEINKEQIKKEQK